MFKQDESVRLKRSFMAVFVGIETYLVVEDLKARGHTKKEIDDWICRHMDTVSKATNKDNTQSA